MGQEVVNAEHSTCESVIRSRADQTGLDLAISPFPFAESYAEFPAQRFTCPHGWGYWVQPTPVQVARLRDMNEAAR